MFWVPCGEAHHEKTKDEMVKCGLAQPVGIKSHFAAFLFSISPYFEAGSVRVCNNTSFFVQTLHSCDQKRQKTCDHKNVPNAETVQCRLVCKHQPLPFAADIPNRCRWLECWGNSRSEEHMSELQSLR